MLTLESITENTNEVIERLKKKHFDAKNVIAKVLEINKKYKSVKQLLDINLSELNRLSNSIGQWIREKKVDQTNLAKNRVIYIKKEIKRLNLDKEFLKKELVELLCLIPNIPSTNVPIGKNSKENVIEKIGGYVPILSKGALPHWDLSKKYDLIDFELGVKITGTGFPVYKQKIAQLQRALINFFLDNAQEAGYIEIQPPYMINADSGYRTGQLPDKDGQMYYCQVDNLYLIPTAEIPITNVYRDIILEEKDLPVMNTAYSACFRKEAGSYGREVRGLNRLHQFDKVEIIRIDKPEHSYESLQEMIDYVQNLVEKLELPWRIVRLCGGDMGFASALTFDFEVYSAGQKRWLEVSSVTNFENYQANRLKCRYRKKKNKKIQLCHTLNGSALALPRVVAALLENNQTKEGIQIPKVLVPYTKFDWIKFYK